MSIQLSGHIIAEEHTNLTPSLILIHSTYHQPREITSRACGNMKYDNG